jgi:hypothetical protein
MAIILAEKPTKKRAVRIEQLENAVDNRDFHKFHFLIKSIDLSDFLPYEITRIVDFCLSINMVSLAYDLAAKARKLYPGNDKINRAYQALSPPKIIGTRPPQAKNIEKSQQWLNENASNYKGKWVAVNDGKFLAAASSLKGLKTKISKKYMNPGTIIEKVLP